MASFGQTLLQYPQPMQWSWSIVTLPSGFTVMISCGHFLAQLPQPRAFLVVDYCRETSAAESVLYGAVRVLANIERHAAARAAEADFHELIHLLIFEAPNHLLEFDIQRLPDQTGIAGIVNMLLSLFLRYRLCQPVFHRRYSRHVEEQAAQRFFVFGAVVGGTANAPIHLSDVFSAIDGVHDQVYGQNRGFALPRPCPH